MCSVLGLTRNGSSSTFPERSVMNCPPGHLLGDEELDAIYGWLIGQ